MQELQKVLPMSCWSQQNLLLSLADMAILVYLFVFLQTCIQNTCVLLFHITTNLFGA